MPVHRIGNNAVVALCPQALQGCLVGFGGSACVREGRVSATANLIPLVRKVTISGSGGFHCQGSCSSRGFFLRYRLRLFRYGRSVVSFGYGNIELIQLTCREFLGGFVVVADLDCKIVSCSLGKLRHVQGGILLERTGLNCLTVIAHSHTPSRSQRQIHWQNSQGIRSILIQRNLVLGTLPGIRSGENCILSLGYGQGLCIHHVRSDRSNFRFNGVCFPVYCIGNYAVIALCPQTFQGCLVGFGGSRCVCKGRIFTAANLIPLVRKNTISSSGSFHCQGSCSSCGFFLRYRLRLFCDSRGVVGLIIFGHSEFFR